MVMLIPNGQRILTGYCAIIVFCFFYFRTCTAIDPPKFLVTYNSVLDDNTLLILPSGERLSIPDNLRIILEVDGLDQATPDTVSRCGMV